MLLWQSVNYIQPAHVLTGACYYVYVVFIFTFHTESLSMFVGSHVAGAERELQLWPLLPACQRQGWQVP